ncbi:ribosomal-processing cysteine protease Prp [Anaerococcus sp. NML200574]|uniref:Ribosomal processing cysteine protease Prp n=1 Tax=Anaerococcus kampingae TaxID=3115614 RepID=A0ABW9MCH5_9FIRM|nr:MULTISPECIES: ribosomal-processing cysteine protease Prp [unclassified Anaerococcus]MCW6678041.1 ribosomal-processing cysteine protease Prp [Anaerococcus sp. NML200574]
MINVDLLIDNKDEIVGFEIKGHAEYDEYGKDLVCSAVTILAYTCVNSLDKYADDVIFTDDEVMMSVNITSPNRDTDVIFDYFKTGIETLLGNYSSYVKLKYKEKS